ncbi:HpcH/HpaI aldolase family protein [Lacisediminihabitans profunda]|uniref:2,4-dihydroxyhept-2-ene-1,7-dioic acid aldolase n=1 Tax=Lacisediminihabitans profunda TaxID=2594790 RepID=A0A5C8UNV3_9MICO|nr:aldolase/citrate lyase family protein [Lacisediminihabitans profunda]TXN29978.1 2,4-dihydroxyhept-2-ene-1,7-dioic acid aldolase [Lacisediminihabitans profunda]
MSEPRRSLLRAALARTEGPALGTFVKLPSQETVELIAIAGFDFIVIDLEHSPMDLETASRHIGVARALGVSSVVRVPGLAGGWVQRILDAGAEGIMLPHVDTVEQAEAGVRAVRFEPWGLRGVGSTSRAGDWGLMPQTEYLRFGQEEVVFMPQIESGEGAANAAAIAAVRGVDALFIGTNDMSNSVGKPQGGPEMNELTQGVIRAAKAAGLPVGNPAGVTREAVQSAVDQGYTFLVQSNDTTLFATAAAAAVKAGRSVGFA